MNNLQFPPANIFYTATHEWIRVTKDSALIGVTHLKMNNIRKINKIDFFKVYGLKNKGVVFASIVFDRGKTDILMPVSGTIICLNSKMQTTQNQLLTNTEMDNWLVRINIAKPFEYAQLLSPEQYASRLARS